MSMQESGTKGPVVAPMPEPTFGTVRKGYDPKQVTEYLKAMRMRLRVLEEHASELETDLEKARSGVVTPPPGRPDSTSEDPYGSISDRVAEVVRAFDQEVEKMRADAEAEAQRVRDEAREEAERIRAETQELSQKTTAEVEERSQKATAEADELTAEAAKKAEAMLTDARAEADRIRVDAQANAESVRAEADRALQDARERADAELSDLSSRKASLVAEIRSLLERMHESTRTLEPALEGQSDDVVRVEGSEKDESEAPVSP